jgi:DNA-binding MarR family transcriptional regulator
MLGTSTRDTMNEPEITPDERRAIHKTLRLFDVIRSVDPTMPMGTVASFLHVAYNEGQSVRDLEVLGFSSSAASNHARYLGEGVSRSGKPGLGLISLRKPTNDHRRGLLSLTPKGEMLAAQIHNVVGR